MNHHAHAFGNILGMVAAVPARVVRNVDCPDPAAADEAAKITGVTQRRWVRDGQDAAALNLAAAQVLLQRMGWDGAALDLIVHVSQTPTRQVPADVYTIAHALGASCACVQVNWSCAGYVYGLWTAMRLLEPGQRGLLLVGDANSLISDPGDRATAPLFGDAGSATAIVGGHGYAGQVQHFVMGTDGAGAEKLCTRASRALDYGPHLAMDGSAVFSYTLRTVPGLANELTEYIAEPDLWFLHNANLFMLKHLVKKAGIPPERAPFNIQRFGNTSCASIPLVMCTDAAERLKAHSSDVAMIGFGAGWAHAAAAIRMEKLQVCELIEI